MKNLISKLFVVVAVTAGANAVASGSETAAVPAAVPATGSVLSTVGNFFYAIPGFAKRQTWDRVVAHPYLTTGGVLGLAALYYAYQNYLVAQDDSEAVPAVKKTASK